METKRSRLSWRKANLDSPLQTAILACLVATLSYLAPRLEGALILHPQTVWPLWPGCALLVSVLLLVPRRIWPILIPVSFAAFVLYDLQAGVPIGSIAWFIPADTVQVLIAAFCLSYFFGGVPRLHSVRNMATYSFFAVLLAPSAAAFLSAFGVLGDYWTSWRISFLSEVLAFVTLTPAVLGWVSDGPSWVRKSRAYHLEFAALIAGLVLLSYITFTASESRGLPALLYSLVPFLVWAALRFGPVGVSTSVIVVAILSIWGSVHGRGPFTIGGSLNSVSSLQLFLVFTSAPFMVLAALVEERKQAEQALRESEEWLHLAVQAGRMYAFDWDAATDVIVRSGQCRDILNWLDDPTRDTGRQFVARVHPEDREAYAAPEAGLSPKNPIYQTSYRVLRPDGSVIWLEANGRILFDGQGRKLRIIGLVADVTERKRAEEALRESEERFRLVADTAPALIWMSGTDKLCTFFNKGWLNFTGRSIDLELRNGKAEGVHSEDLKRCLDTYVRAFDAREKFTMQYRLRRHDGEYRWVLDVGVPRFNQDGSFAGFIGSCADVTDRKLAEEALSGVNRRLIEAQERERARIARELHDDICQRLALLIIELEQLWENSPDLPDEVRSRVGVLREQASDVATDVQSLSHELHSSKLEYLGILTAMKGLCKEFSDQQNVEVVFAHEEVPRSVSQEISLCLYRVLQEALQNAAKHSGVRHFDVELRVTSGAIDLIVRDSGSGFEVEEAMKTHGLGLVSMAERLKLVDGELSVDSQPQRGTTIHARVPLSKAARAAS